MDEGTLFTVEEYADAIVKLQEEFDQSFADLQVRSAQSLNVFKSLLKTHLYSLAFG